MNFEELIALIEHTVGHELDVEDVSYLNIAYQAGRNAQAQRDVDMVAGVFQP